MTSCGHVKCSRYIAIEFGVNQSVMVRLLQKYHGNMSERQRSGRPRKTSVCQDRGLARRALMMPLKLEDVLGRSGTFLTSCLSEQ